MPLKQAFDSLAFRKTRLWYMFLLMIPSFAVDAVILYRIITRHPTAMTNEGMIDIFGVTIMFFVNFVILKGYALLIYYLLKYIRKRSCVMIHHNKVVYHKRRLVMSAESYNEAYFTDYEIKNIENVIVRKSGAVITSYSIHYTKLYDYARVLFHDANQNKIV